MNSRRWIATLLVCSFLIGTCAAQGWADEPSQPKDAEESGSTGAAVVSNIIYIPGKAIVCGMSGVLWTVTMLLTFGALYQESADFVKGGCGGQWVVRSDDFKPPAKSY
jgi:hypothetical protein